VRITFDLQEKRTKKGRKIEIRASSSENGREFQGVSRRSRESLDDFLKVSAVKEKRGGMGFIPTRRKKNKGRKQL